MLTSEFEYKGSFWQHWILNCKQSQLHSLHVLGQKLVGGVTSFLKLQDVDAYIKNETLLAVSFEMYENVLPVQANSSLPVVLAFSATMKGLNMLPSVEINLVVSD